MTPDVSTPLSPVASARAACVSPEGERVAGACASVGEAAPFFSIVMPCYGVEAYIGQALECILKQTERSWELIVVDDATPDGSALIAERAAAGDARIRVVHHKRNLGLSGARNTGISQARGKYVWICDPDDTYESDVLSRARSALERSHADVCLFGYCEEYYDEAGAFMYRNDLPLEAGEYLSPQDWYSLVIAWESSTHFGYAWNKIYRRACIDEGSCSYENVRLIEDVLFNVEFFARARSVVVLDGTPYHYAKRKGSSLTNANAYGAREYFDLHVRRVSALRDLLCSWDVLDEHAAGILGGLYGRYVLSALERACYPREGLSHEQRIAWCREILGIELSRTLLPQACDQGSRALRAGLSVLKTSSPRLCVAFARTIYLVHTKAYGVFTRLRSGR